MKSHEIDYKIIGNDIQIVEVELDPNETVIAEAGAMLYMEENINFETKMGDGSEPEKGIFGKLMSAGARMITGESLFMTHFTQRGGEKGKVAFAAPYPGTVTPVQLASCNNNTLIVQKDAFLCAALGTKISIHLNRRFGSGFFGGEGFIMQKLQGDGMAFFHAGGTIIEKELNGESLKVDTGCIVAFEEGITMDIQKAGNLKSMFLGGEGLFLATLSGTGKVWLQSMPLSKLVQALSPMSKTASKATSLGGLLGGD
ncbi:TIGR00266 family protein [Bernardetia litoralis DSM 6794]|uniref:TIGR00266 family protein n=1 Tax=Bernardetia litoralis (strain ATCC 23117 / DSM 6794 / NBRC 15988 / NCIMB 1366 / Fx l1 / Sio-4) TaxID=880071 RepID=I4AGQ8_BERLS|nr:TIGR00266 family protein [Bernardetia litoralis]AFM03143.1 TIGR00266 family protein [Bernardetia litoralis DSM 6794]